ncbi:IclR family transcriptional regulator [Natrinema gelatinilyticum]|uniref:IclR family transcriptional regulator n=1 Tax=Natrinema gelatinilyticum TaxID=2961571 RepID=UPI0020C5293E|nr:IclR family transcriptional regulator [Natrinema gelatinilyticum]
MDLDEREGIKSNETLFELVDTLKQLDGAGITELADRMDVSKSTIYRHLTTLLDAEYVVRDGQEFRLSLKFLEYGGYVRRTNEIAKQIRPRIEDLADKTGELSAYVTEEYGQGVFVYRGIGENAVGTDGGVGKRFHLNSLAAGKAILAEYPSERVDEIIETQGLPAYTNNTITEADELRAELDVVREQGYAFDHEEHLKGLNAVAARVYGPNGEPQGAFSIAGPSHRMKGDWFESEIPELLLGTITEFQLDITYA